MSKTSFPHIKLSKISFSDKFKEQAPFFDPTGKIDEVAQLFEQGFITKESAKLLVQKIIQEEEDIYSVSWTGDTIQEGSQAHQIFDAPDVQDVKSGVFCPFCNEVMKFDSYNCPACGRDERNWVIKKQGRSKPLDIKQAPAPGKRKIILEDD